MLPSPASAPFPPRPLTLTHTLTLPRHRDFLMQGPGKKAPSLINVLMQLRKVRYDRLGPYLSPF